MTKKKQAAPRAGGPDLGCYVRQLPPPLAFQGAQVAVEINPANAPNREALGVALGVAFSTGAPADLSGILPPSFLVALTSKYWGPKGVDEGVYFMDGPTSGTRSKILAHMNAWGSAGRVAVRFRESSSRTARVRIARENSGYWSYLGTDVLSIPQNEPTMNLQGFTESTPEAEYRRVVRHETGHTLGFPHEHMRREIINRLDAAKTIAYFRQYQGWSETVTRQQVLTPLEEASLLSPPPADETSIMSYQLPGSITKDGRPVPGGPDINPADYEYAARIYPGAAAPPPPPDGGDGTGTGRFRFAGKLTVEGARMEPGVWTLSGGPAGRMVVGGVFSVTGAELDGTVTRVG